AETRIKLEEKNNKKPAEGLSYPRRRAGPGPSAGHLRDTPAKHQLSLAAGEK
ncbi:Mating-type-like protein ALPHA2, silenced copy at MTL3, partial [Clarias magur]